MRAQDVNGSLRVLIVDDNEDAAETLAVLVRLWGYDVRTAYGAESGLESAQDYRPDCLLLDINMPGMDGYTLARQLRREPQLCRSRLVALSAYSSDEHGRRALEAGFDHCLVKPADPAALEGLLAMLQQTLRLAERTEALAHKNVKLAEETKALLTEVKDELREVREEIREVKQEMRDGREPNGGNPERSDPPQPGDRTDM